MGTKHQTRNTRACRQLMQSPIGHIGRIRVRHRSCCRRSRDSQISFSLISGCRQPRGRPMQRFALRDVNGQPIEVCCPAVRVIRRCGGGRSHCVVDAVIVHVLRVGSPGSDVPELRPLKPSTTASTDGVASGCAAFSQTLVGAEPTTSSYARQQRSSGSSHGAGAQKKAGRRKPSAARAAGGPRKSMPSSTRSAIPWRSR